MKQLQHDYQMTEDLKSLDANASKTTIDSNSARKHATRKDNNKV